MNVKTDRTFHYADGEAVKVHDVVMTGNQCKGRVLKIIQPLSLDAEHFHCPEGGILIEEQWDGENSLLVMTPPDGPQWEDLVVVSHLGT